MQELQSNFTGQRSLVCVSTAGTSTKAKDHLQELLQGLNDSLLRGRYKKNTPRAGRYTMGNHEIKWNKTQQKRSISLADATERNKWTHDEEHALILLYGNEEIQGELDSSQRYEKISLDR